MAASKYPVRITAKDISVPPPEAVSIHSPELVNHLIQNTEKALALLNKISPIDIRDIEIDRDGKVIVRNPEFARALKECPRIGEEGGETEEPKNGVCGLGC